MTQSIDHHGRVIVFRTDASVQIGTGHVMRCLTLAEALRAEGADCHFLCREHSGHLSDAIRVRGFNVQPLPLAAAQAQDKNSNDAACELEHAHWLGNSWEEDARQSREIVEALAPDWLVVDHYALDTRWEATVLRDTTATRLLVIDDLADRSHRADLLLDQNLGRRVEDYSGLMPRSCRLLIGPQYALLRPEFARLREASLARRRARPELKQLLITMGGVDKDNATSQVLDAIKVCDLPEDCRITVVMGATAPWLSEVKAAAMQMPRPTEVVVNVTDMAERMANADLAIGAAGSTSWERCCLGLPTLMVVLADNQQAIADALDTAGAAKSLGTPAILSELSEHWRSMTRPEALARMINAAAAITDGLGSATVVQTMAKR